MFLPLIETLWLRFGPFMRMIYGRVGTTGLVDHHKRAIAAAERGQARELSEAIRLDIHEGMQLIAEALKDQDAAGAGGPLPARRRRAV